MRYVDEYRAPEQVMQRAHLLPHTAARPLRIMEVCGGHTHAIFKFGLDQLLPENIEFIHGPGCPVCVLPMGRIDACIEIASRPGVIFCTFGDAMRVPGKNGSLLQAKASGADVRIVYSPMDALRLAQQNPQPPSPCVRRGSATSKTSSFSVSTSPCCRPCAVCWISRTTVSTPFSPPATSVW